MSVLRGRFIFALLTLVLMTAALCGCASDPTQGYSAMGIYPDDVSTVAVPIFENDTFTREVEFDLTEALIKEIEARTPYKVVDRSRADTVLIGRVKEVELDQLSKSKLTGLSEEVILRVTIDFEWRHQQTGRLLVERREFEGQGLFVPSRPTGEPIELGTFATVQQLARDIVDEMQAAW